MMAQTTTPETAADPITLEIVQNALQAAADEMFAAMRKTAMSAIIYEVLDMGTGITDADGEIASSGAGIPAFIGVLDKAVKRILALHGANGDTGGAGGTGRAGGIEPGDIFVTNDPYYGGVTHLNDIVLAKPVFADGEIVAWTANIAHFNDVGGKVPGSLSTDAGEIFQEGLRLPAVKLFSRGEPIAAVLEIMKANSRLPDFLEGDLWAGVAAVRVGERRLLDLIERYGKATFERALKSYMDYGEQVSLAALKQLPKGRFELAEEQDDGRTFKVALEIRDDAFIVDLTDNPDQDDGPNNASADGAAICAQMGFKAVTDPSLLCTGGSFRPLTVLTRRGSVFDAQPPAALGFYFEVEIRLYDLIWRCLADHMPERMAAGHFASICGTVIGGPHPETGRHYTIVEPELGGWGADARGDGAAGQFSGFHGETFNCPAEVAEARYGLFVDRMALDPQPGGEGRHRGGAGLAMDYRVRSDGCFLTCGYTRARTQPWGLDGGRDGTNNYIEIRRRDGTQERHAYATAITVNEGDVIGIRTGTGGGYGDPKQRDRAAVARDIRNGLISPDRAREVYGYEG